MAEEIVVSLRLPHVLRDAADALVPRLQVSREYAWGSWSRSAVLRLAVSRGLAAIERELAGRALSPESFAGTPMHGHLPSEPDS